MRCTTPGAPWTSTGWCSTSWCRIGGTRRRPSASSGACSPAWGTSRSAIVTDGPRSYGVARSEVLPDVRHRASRYLNNRAENSRAPTRRRESQAQRAVQVADAGPALPASAQHDLRPLSPAAAPDDRRAVPPRPRRGLPGLAAGDLSPARCVNAKTIAPLDPAQPSQQQLGDADRASSGLRAPLRPASRPPLSSRNPRSGRPAPTRVWPGPAGSRAIGFPVAAMSQVLASAPLCRPGSKRT